MHLDDSYDDENVFAKILRGEMPAVKVYEDEHTLSFMDIMPVTEGHTLVIPKSPATNLLTLDTDYLAPFMATTQKVAAAVRRGLECEGVMIAQLSGAAAGQTVFHIHMHVIPRSSGLSLDMHGREMQEADILEATAAKIRAAL